ncbi:MAG: Cof-type HAD-IIB family hydrolase [Propionibacteriaceae bacterium]|nr:Cof-type HAD-IIB family hydrolase [Propionibacteriaceae bacterium]
MTGGPSDQPGWRPRLVVVDADGTIADEHGIVPLAVVEALKSIDSAGIPVVLDTGRAWLSARLILDQLGLEHQYCVCSNGAMVVTYPPLEVLHTVSFDPGPIAAAIADHPSVVMAVEDFGQGYCVSRPFPPGAYELHGRTSVVGLGEVASRPVPRVILSDPGASRADFDVLVAGLDLRGLTSFRSGDTWIDIVANGADKAQGLAIVAKRIGVDPGDVLAFGDSYNDMALLEWSGRGVALGDAPKEVRAAADVVTAGFDDGGVVSELNRWFPHLIS